MKNNKHLYLDILLVREYFKHGTNGTLYINGDKHCHTIELPWVHNRPRISCIPEGRYQLVKRYSPRFKHHLQLLDVPERDYILIHPANNAQQELQGCIAPVTAITGHGCGSQSRIAFNSFMEIVCKSLAEGLVVWVDIISKKELQFELEELANTKKLYKKTH